MPRAADPFRDPRRLADLVQRATTLFGIPDSVLQDLCAERSPEAAAVIWRNAVDQRKSTYRRLAKERHPDHGGDVESFLVMQSCWEVLNDPRLPRVFWATFNRPRPQFMRPMQARPVRVVVMDRQTWTTSSTTSSPFDGGTASFYHGSGSNYWRT